MEIYRNRPTTVRIEAPVPEAVYNTVTVSSASGESQVVPTYVDHYIPWDGVPVLEIPIEFKHTWYDGQVTLKINVNDRRGIDHSYDEYVDVVTPMFRKQDLPPEFSDADTVELERLVRHVIERFTGQSFGRTRKRILVSDGLERINLTQPLVEFTGISERFATHSTTLRKPKIPFEVLDGGFTLAINWPLYDIKTDSVWISRSRAPQMRIIEGVFGYDRVPQAVKEAALLIAGMWGCKQAVWRDRYIQTMRSADWSVTYHHYEGFGGTTGSQTADLLLSEYVRRHMPEVI